MKAERGLPYPLLLQVVVRIAGKLRPGKTDWNRNPGVPQSSP
jgi:hypothetical protein